MDPTSYQNPILFFANAIGDHLLALPTVRALSKIFTGRLSLLTTTNSPSKIIFDVPFQRTLFLPPGSYLKTENQNPKKDISKALTDWDGVIHEIRNCDLFLSLTLWHTQELQFLLDQSELQNTIGFLPQYNYKLPSNQEHAFDIYFNAVKLFAPTTVITTYAYPPTIQQKYLQLAHEFRNSIRDSYRLLVVHTDTKRRKIWPSDNFSITIDKFLERHTNYIAVIVGLRHNLTFRGIHTKARVIDFSRTPLGLSFAIVSIADIFLGIDSCMLHTADLFRIPSVGIFGPTDPYKWGFRFATHKHIRLQELKQLEVNVVLQALLEVAQTS